MRKYLGLTTILGSFFTCTGPALAKEPVTLKVGDYMVANHYIVEAGLKPWMDEISAGTRGEVKFQYYPAQQLGKAGDLLRLTQANVAQVASLFSIHAGDKLELSGVGDLPGLFTTSCQGTKAFMAAARSGPIAERDFKANGVHLLYAFVFRPYQLFSLHKPIRSVADVKGMKTMVPGRAAEMMFNNASAVSMKLISGPDTYQSAQKGIIDAFLLNPESLYIYDLQSLTKYATRNGNFGQLVSLYLVNEKVWNGFDDATKALITAASERAAMRTCKAIDDGYEKAFERMRADKIDIVNLSPDAQREFRNLADQAVAEWAKGLESRGRPAKQVLELIRRATPPGDQ
ncbi:MAG TPA: TRAP transporter substrate-binding protein DctP [Ramlibacter sp.]|nr:TRAP transporter substrate-binding protein DctP [Ramlibacter sp.]